MANQKKSGLGWKIGGYCFALAGLLWTVSGNIPIGMMNVAIGMMFITLGLAKTRKSRDQKVIANKSSESSRSSRMNEDVL